MLMVHARPMQARAKNDEGVRRMQPLPQCDNQRGAPEPWSKPLITSFISARISLRVVSSYVELTLSRYIHCTWQHVAD